MEGTVHMQKTKLDNKHGGDLVNTLVSGVGDFTDIFANKLLTRNSYFAIKKGVLYQYENQKSRKAIEMLKINKITAISVMKGNESKKFQMIYENQYFIMECPESLICLKWVNSIKHVQENYDEYEQDNDDKYLNKKANATRYENLKVFEKITGKSCFKDYEVLIEAYEQKTMLDIYIKSMIHMEEYR